MDRPIIMSAPMVRAILAGRKTETRRIIKPQPDHWRRDLIRTVMPWARADLDQLRPDPDERGARLRFVVGDRLWVREPWNPHSLYAHLPPREMPVSKVFYGADDAYAPSNTPWKPSIHMPRWASRITLAVTEVRVERLQEIDENGAVAEGMTPFLASGLYISPKHADGKQRFGDNAYTMFRDLWNSLHGPNAWDANPWVAVIRFVPTLANIDQEVSGAAAR